MPRDIRAIIRTGRFGEFRARGGSMFQMNEVMTLCFFCVGLGVLVFFLRKGYVSRFPFLISAYCCILASNLFSVIEGFWLLNLFNLLEHAAYLASGACMFAGVIGYMRRAA